VSLGRLQVDDEFELDRLLERDVTRLRALEDRTACREAEIGLRELNDRSWPSGADCLTSSKPVQKRHQRNTTAGCVAHLLVLQSG
jgi:hypothetical protein